MVQLPSRVHVLSVACHTFSQLFSHCLPSPKPRWPTILAMLQAAGAGRAAAAVSSKVLAEQLPFGCRCSSTHAHKRWKSQLGSPSAEASPQA